MKRIALIVLLLTVMAGFARTELAAKDDQYYPIMQGDEDMRSLQSEKNMVSSGFQYGAWITPVIIYQDARGNELGHLGQYLPGLAQDLPLEQQLSLRAGQGHLLRGPLEEGLRLFE